MLILKQMRDVFPVNKRDVDIYPVEAEIEKKIRMPDLFLSVNKNNKDTTLINDEQEFEDDIDVQIETINNNFDESLLVESTSDELLDDADILARKMSINARINKGILHYAW